MEDISSQSMSEAEVYWNCDSPTPTAWKRHQIPCSNEPRRHGNSQDVKHIPHTNKKVKTTLFEVDKKSFDTARKLIRELGKQNNDINNSLDSIFERSGNGEQLASAATSDTKQTVEEDFWEEELLSDECLMQKLNEIQTKVPSVSTSTPARPAAIKHKATSSNADDLCTPDDCIEFFMSAEMKNEKPRKNSPVLRSKGRKQQSELANFSISDEVLSQLIMDDSWVESCNEPKATKQAKKTSCGNCHAEKTGNSSFAKKKAIKDDESESFQNQIKPGQHSVTKSVSNPNKVSSKMFLNKGTVLKPKALNQNHPSNNCMKTSTVLKNNNSQILVRKTTYQQQQNSNHVLKRISVERENKTGTTSNLSTVRKTEIVENLFSEDDEDLLLQAVILTESQKSLERKVSLPNVKPQNRKCSADEIERKKREAIKRRLQKTRK